MRHGVSLAHISETTEVFGASRCLGKVTCIVVGLSKRTSIAVLLKLFAVLKFKSNKFSWPRHFLGRFMFCLDLDLAPKPAQIGNGTFCHPSILELPGSANVGKKLSGRVKLDKRYKV